MAGRDAGEAAEDARELELICESDLTGNRAECPRGGEEQRAGSFDPFLAQESHGRDSGAQFELAAEMEFTQPGLPREIIEGDGFSEVVLNEGFDLSDHRFSWCLREKLIFNQQRIQ